MTYVRQVHVGARTCRFRADRALHVMHVSPLGDVHSVRGLVLAAKPFTRLCRVLENSSSDHGGNTP